MTLRYLSDFSRSLGMPLINYKVELKLKWQKYCVLSAFGTESIINNNNNDNNIILTNKDTKLCALVVTLSARNNQELSNILSKGFGRSVYWSEYRKKGRIKIRQTKIDTFSNQILLK